MGNKELDMHHQARHTLWMGDMNYRLDMQQPSHAEDWEVAPVPTNGPCSVSVAGFAQVAQSSCL